MTMSSTNEAASRYISSRPAPAHVTALYDDKDNVVVMHRVQLGANESSTPAASALRFPRPENIWLSRDVDRADWAAFTKHLLPRQRPGANMTAPATTTVTTKATSSDEEDDADSTANESARRQRLNDIVSQWNKDFFESRGLNIIAQFGDDVIGATASPDGETTSGADAGSTKQVTSRGYGLKLGNSLFGVSLPPHSHGYGLRLGGVLLGVRVDDESDGDQKEEPSL